jgi:hypothetical protein
VLHDAAGQSVPSVPEDDVRILDLRKVSVNEMVEGMNKGEAWAWVLMRQLVGASAMISRARGDGAPPSVVVEAPAPTLRSTEAS